MTDFDRMLRPSLPRSEAYKLERVASGLERRLLDELTPPPNHDAEGSTLLARLATVLRLRTDHDPSIDAAPRRALLQRLKDEETQASALRRLPPLWASVDDGE